MLRAVDHFVFCSLFLKVYVFYTLLSVHSACNQPVDVPSSAVKMPRVEAAILLQLLFLVFDDGQAMVPLAELFGVAYDTLKHAWVPPQARRDR